MFKLLLFIVVGFLVYQWYLKPLLNPPPASTPPTGQHKGSKHNDEEYVDYEEIK